MDHLSRVIYWSTVGALLLFGGLLASASVQAAGTVAGSGGASTYTYTVTSNPNCSNQTDARTCLETTMGLPVPAAGTASGRVYSYNTGSQSYWNAFFCFTSTATANVGGTCSVGSGGNYAANLISTSGGCPVNSGGTPCTCNAGYTPDGAGTACVAMSGACATIVSGANAVGGTYSFTANVAAAGGTAFCSGGCSIEATTGGFRKDGAQWIGTFLGPFKAGTASCADAVPVASAVASCPSPQVSGTVNGTTVCYTPATTSTSSSTGASAPAGVASAPAARSTPSGTEVDIPAGGTASRNTTCSAAGCTTVTTIKNAAGATVGTYSDSEPKDSFCAENPEISICKSSTFGGACGGAFVCDGDAIQCAIAKDQLARHCEVFEGVGALKTLGDEAIARGDTRAADHPAAVANVETIGTGTSGVDSTDLLAGSASCMADEVVTVTGDKTVTLSWSQLCAPLGWLGNVLVGLTALAWVFIAFKQG